MLISFQKLQCDVMARLGENDQPSASYPQMNLPSTEDAIGIKIRSMLPIVGKRLISEANPAELGGAESLDVPVSFQLMPCGLYAAEISLPENLVRIVSVKMGSWKREAVHIVMPGDEAWSRQWSGEPGIAGNPDRPIAYLIADGDGFRLRAMGSPTDEDTLSYLYAWRIPEADSDGNFQFPASLYPSLVENISPPTP